MAILRSGLRAIAHHGHVLFTGLGGAGTLLEGSGSLLRAGAHAPW